MADKIAAITGCCC